jgi:hypothetical protein
MKKQSLGILAVISTFGLVTGCGSSRDVALTGTVTTDAAVSGGPVRIEFYEHQSSSDQTASASNASDLKFVDAVPLDAPGKFSHTVPIEGDTVHLVAFIDANKDEKCTDGEAWGAADVTIQSDNTATASLNITAQTKCPTLPAAN